MTLKELLVELIIAYHTGVESGNVIDEARKYKAEHPGRGVLFGNIGVPGWVNCLCNDLGINPMATVEEAFEDWRVSDD